MPATIIPFVPRSAVRKAQPSDLEELLRMGQAFCLVANMPFDRQTMTAFTMQHMGAGGIFVSEAPQGLGGMLVGALHPLYTDSGCVAATELAWWVDPAWRGSGVARRLLQAFEAWANAAGATFVSVSAEAAMDGERVGKLYEHAGYSLRELTYVRRIKE